MKLYEITGAIHDLEKMLEDGLPPEQIEESLSDIAGDFDTKAKDILFVLANMDGEIEKFRSEEARLKERRLTAEKQKARLVNYLRYNMEQVGISTIQNGVMTAKLSKPRAIVEVLDESEIPEQYLSIKTSVSVDKKELLKALKENQVPGAVLGESKPSLTIK